MLAAHLAPEITEEGKIDLQGIRHDQGVIDLPGEPKKEVPLHQII
jgi:hypothetical protein